MTPAGRSFIDWTKNRQAGPLLQSRYENKDKEFFPAYSTKQLAEKNKHTYEILQKLGKNVTKYNELSKNEKLRVDVTIVEELLGQSDSELYTNVIRQGREPISLVLNRGLENYSLKNHIATFERRPEICEYNSYISNYISKKIQIENFDLSNSTSITYKNLIGDSYTNIGSFFGEIKSPTDTPIVNKTDSPTSVPTVNNVDSEL